VEFSLVERFHGSTAGSKARQRRLTIKYYDPQRAALDPPGILDWPAAICRCGGVNLAHNIRSLVRNLSLPVSA
jgi:hypothetical protein